MRPVIYIDILLAVNFLVDYLLLLAVSHMLEGETSRLSLCLGAAAGALFSCTILLPALPLAARIASTVTQAAIMALAAFGIKRRRRYFKSVLLIVITGGVYGGLMFAMWYLLRPKGMIIANGFVYLDISPTVLVAATIICYACLTLWARINRSTAAHDTLCTVKISTERGEVTLNGIIDTGNMLTEPFSGYPVLLAGDELNAIAPKNSAAALRVIPYSSISGEGLLLGFRPMMLEVKAGEQYVTTDRVYVAVRSRQTGGDFEAIVNPAIMKM